MSKSRFFCCLGHRISKSSEILTSNQDGTPDTVELATGLSARDRKLIKDTADIIFGQLKLQNKGVVFLIAFFKAYPHHQRYFKMFRGIPPDELKSIPHTENHGRRVMSNVALLVQHIEEPNVIKEQLVDLLIKHNPRSVKPRQMKDMLNMFVDFTSQQLGAKFTSQHETAWRKLTTHILSVLEEAAAATSQQSNGSAVSRGNGNVSNRNDQEECRNNETQNSNKVQGLAGDAEEVDVIKYEYDENESESDIQDEVGSHGDNVNRW